jgi:hypothetical protein
MAMSPGASGSGVPPPTRKQQILKRLKEITEERKIVLQDADLSTAQESQQALDALHDEARKLLRELQSLP